MTLTGGMILAACAVPAIATAPTPAVRPQSAPVVKTHSGDVQGVVENSVFAFKGIPYASPPVGNLRWREPRLAAPWQGVRKADAYGNACIQPPGASALQGGTDPSTLSEDCLYLNVWTPKLDPSAKLPVMAWIHGGAYIFGAGGLPEYDGGPLAKKGAVVVNLNYRLGQLGFFAHPALEKDVPKGPANFGLLDTIAALSWVRRNIAQFGGDPNNVTIFGQSAGAKSVVALFASPLARGLFHKGIAQSNPAIPDTTRAKALEVGIKIADAVGLKGAGATAAELRAVPAERFGQLKGPGLSNTFPISGDTVLPQSIQDIFAAGKEAPLPLILGNTSDDGSVAVAFGIDPADVIKRLGVARIAVRALYPGVKDDRELGRQVARDLVFTMAARWTADRHSRLAPSWRYYFDYTAVKDRAKFPNGVPHGGDILFVLNTGDIFHGAKGILTDEDREFARRVSDYWFEFARTGKPASKGGPEWPNHNNKQDRTMLFGKTIAVQANFMRPRLNTFITVIKILGKVLNR